MKTIKDILKADSIEQRRRIANNLAISKEDKNALIVNQSSGGGGDSDDVNIEYYKVMGMPTGDEAYNAFLQTIILNSAFINYNQNRTHWIGAGSIIINLDDAFTYNILAIGFINKKLITVENEEVTTTEGTLQERADIFASLMGVPKININDYLEPITEEEFYNIKPE